VLSSTTPLQKVILYWYLLSSFRTNQKCETKASPWRTKLSLLRCQKCNCFSICSSQQTRQEFL